MRQTITISVSGQLKKTLDEAAREAGVSRSDVLRECLRDQLLLRKFRSLRKRMLAKARTRKIYTDQDVFDRIS